MNPKLSFAAPIRLPLINSFAKTSKSGQKRSHQYFQHSKLPPMSAPPNANTRRQFASDNYAGICPEAFAAMVEANRGHEGSYGNDTWTEKATKLIRDVFESACETFFVFNGTSANSLSLAALCQ